MAQLFSGAYLLLLVHLVDRGHQKSIPSYSEWSPLTLHAGGGPHPGWQPLPSLSTRGHWMRWEWRWCESYVMIFQSLDFNPLNTNEEIAFRRIDFKRLGNPCQAVFKIWGGGWGVMTHYHTKQLVIYLYSSTLIFSLFISKASHSVTQSDNPSDVLRALPCLGKQIQKEKKNVEMHAQQNK